MKRFRFPLRPVAVVRSHRELRAREAFAASVRNYVRAEESLAEVRRRVAELAQLLCAGRAGGCLAGEAASLFQSYRAECGLEITAERAVIAAREDMNRCRAEYLEANRQLKIVSQLEEKARVRHRTENLRLEQMEMDEFAGYRAARRPVLA